MASTFTATKAAATYPVYQPKAGELGCVTSTYEVGTALIVNDIIEMVRVPKNATVVDVILVTDDLDSDGTPAITLDVGYGGNYDYFIAASTVGQAGGVARMAAATAFPLTLTEEDTIDVHVDTAPDAGGTGTITLTVMYLGE